MIYAVSAIAVTAIIIAGMIGWSCGTTAKTVLRVEEGETEL